MLKSYYEILNVSPSATKSEIKSQFKKLAKMYHPDVNSSLEAEQVFKEINKKAHDFCQKLFLCYIFGFKPVKQKISKAAVDKTRSNADVGGELDARLGCCGNMLYKRFVRAVGYYRIDYGKCSTF